MKLHKIPYLKKKKEQTFLKLLWFIVRQHGIRRESVQFSLYMVKKWPYYPRVGLFRREATHFPLCGQGVVLLSTDRPSPQGSHSFSSQWSRGNLTIHGQAQSVGKPLIILFVVKGQSYYPRIGRVRRDSANFTLFGQIVALLSTERTNRGRTYDISLLKCIITVFFNRRQKTR